MDARLLARLTAEWQLQYYKGTIHCTNSKTFLSPELKINNLASRENYLAQKIRTYFGKV